MRLSDIDREAIAARVANHGMTLKDTHLFDAGRSLYIEVGGDGPALSRSASASFISPHRAVALTDANAIPWHELTQVERGSLVSEVITKLRAIVRT